jgi:CRISPR-associated protein Cst1
MSEAKENKITLYPSNWLYNAGVVGLLRVLEWAKGSNITEEVLSQGFESKHLENFEIYYFEYVTRAYLRDEFSFFETRRVFKDEASNKVYGIENDFKKDMDNLVAKKSWEDFLKELKRHFEAYKNKLKPLGKDENVKADKLENALNKDFVEVYEKMKEISLQSNFLGRFYFNKKVIHNPKGNQPKRIKRFKEEYIDKALVLFNNTRDKQGTCFFCSIAYPNTYLSDFTEGDFAPVGVSTEKFINLFYNYNGSISQLNKCSICQVIILCAFAGFNKKPWQVSDIEGTDYIFVNLPTIKEALDINNSFQAFLKNYQIGTITENLYYKGVEIAITSLEKKSRWLIDNILFVEINPTPTKQIRRPKFTYFNIDRGSAETFSAKEPKVDNLLKSLAFSYKLNEQTIYLSTEVIKRILTRKSVKPITYKYIKDYLNKKQNRILPLWSLISLEHLINQRRKQLKEGNKMGVKSTYGILSSIRRSGAEGFLPSEIDQEKRYHIAQRFLSLIRGGRKEDFYNELLRLYVVYEKQVPNQVFSLLSEDDFLTFQEKALAFLTGFVGQPKQEVENE